jgi:hypothetical protein
MEAPASRVPIRYLNPDTARARDRRHPPAGEDDVPADRASVVLFALVREESDGKIAAFRNTRAAQR